MPERIDTKAVLERKAPFRERAKGGPWGPWKQHFREAYDALAQEIADREALEKVIAALRPVYGGVCKVCGNVVSQEGNDIGLDYIEGHAEDCEFAALAAEEKTNV